VRILTLYELACNQDVQDKLRAEIDSVLERYNGKLEYDSMQELFYMEKVINGKLHTHCIL